MNIKVTHEDFVVAWATSRTLDDVVKATEMTKAAVQGRANMLRHKGVKLPKLRMVTVLDDLRIAQLNSLIKKHTAKG